MAYTLEISIRCLESGNDIPGSPWVFQTTVGELDEIQITKAGSDGSTYYTFGRLNEVYCWLLSTDTQINLGFLGNNLGLVLNPGGLILMAGVDMNAGSTANLLVNNISGQTANLTGFECGP